MLVIQTQLWSTERVHIFRYKVNKDLQSKVYAIGIFKYKYNANIKYNMVLEIYNGGVLQKNRNRSSYLDPYDPKSL